MEISILFRSSLYLVSTPLSVWIRKRVTAIQAFWDLGFCILNNWSKKSTINTAANCRVVCMAFILAGLRLTSSIGVRDSNTSRDIGRKQNDINIIRNLNVRRDVSKNSLEKALIEKQVFYPRDMWIEFLINWKSNADFKQKGTLIKLGVLAVFCLRKDLYSRGKLVSIRFILIVK